MGPIWVLLARDGPQVGPRPQMGPRLFPWILLSGPQVCPRPQMGPRLVSWTLLSRILHDILVTGNSSPCRVRWRNDTYSDSQCCKHAKMDVNRWDWSFAVVLLACDDLIIHMIEYTKRHSESQSMSQLIVSFVEIRGSPFNITNVSKYVLFCFKTDYSDKLPICTCPKSKATANMYINDISRSLESNWESRGVSLGLSICANPFVKWCQHLISTTLTHWLWIKHGYVSYYQKWTIIKQYLIKRIRRHIP